MQRASGLLLLLLFLIPLSALGGHKKELSTDLSLPSDFGIDFQLASAQRSRLTASPIRGTEMNAAAEEVFGKIVGTTMIAGYGLPYHWQLAVMNDNNINAGSLPDGEIIVDGGLASLISTNRGLWAAVLSHEVAHTARRHAVREYLYRRSVAEQQAYWRARALAGDKSANWALLGLNISAPIAEKKLSRDLEHDADVTGMLLMARAGYHPDNVFALHHLLRLQTGDQSKFAAFFSTHPRWQTRDQRDEKAYSEALAEYNRLWPDPAGSPGGTPPEVVFVEKPRALEDKAAAATRIAVPMRCRNEADPVLVRLTFEKDKQPVPTSDPSLRDSKGELQIDGQYRCGDQPDAVPFEVSLASAAVSEANRKLQARAWVISSNGKILEVSDPFDVHLPKATVGGSIARVAARSTSAAAPASSVTDSMVIAAPSRNPSAAPTDSGYKALEASIWSLRVGVNRLVLEPIPVQPPAATLRIRANTDGATIEIDGQYVGRTPSTLTVSAGQHVVRIHKQDFRPWKKIVNVTTEDVDITAYMDRMVLTLQ